MDENSSDLNQSINMNNPNEKDDSEPIVIITSSTNANSKMAHHHQQQHQIYSPSEALKDPISLEVYVYIYFLIND